MWDPSDLKTVKYARRVEGEEGAKMPKLASYTGSEIVCSKCGLVIREKQTYGKGFSRFLHQGSPAPTTNIAWGRSLGNTLPKNQLYRVIGKADKKDLPIRARQITTIAQTVEHPTVMKLLDRGSKILKEHGYYVGSVEETKPEHIFADECGRQLRRVGGILAYGGYRIRKYKRLASAIFYLTLQKFDPEKAEELKPHLSFGEKDLTLVQGLLNGLEEVKKHG